MNENLTDITILLDSSGSMWDQKDDTIGGLNSFVAEQKKVEGDANLSYYTFDSGFNHELKLTEHFVAKNIQETKDLEFHPNGGTPLLDAFGTVITKTGERLAAMPEADRPSKVIFVVITDGYENTSKEFTRDGIQKAVKHQEDDYKWSFVFIGANIDAIAEGNSLGFGLANTMQHTQNKKGTESMYGSLSKGISAKRGMSQEAYCSATSNFFDEEDKKEQEEAKASS